MIGGGDGEEKINVVEMRSRVERGEEGRMEEEASLEALSRTEGLDRAAC